MADRRPRPGLRLAASSVALLLAAGAVAFLVWSDGQRNDARDDLTAAQVALRQERASSSAPAMALATAHRALAALQPQLPTVSPSAAAIGKLDEQDLASVRAALQAGLAGDLGAYNRAVDQRAALDPAHDAAVERLRQQVNAIITALDQIRG
ncbi:MAG: hypothetical protein QOF40_1336 [Actinomycetota bacterium]|nr:hypothetical protein [Actinomycetota bacterium]